MHGEGGGFVCTGRGSGSGERGVWMVALSGRWFRYVRVLYVLN